jgi:hypothetical protein
MSKLIVFVHVHGRPGLIEAEIPDNATLAELQEVLRAAAVEIDAEMLVFVEDAEHHHPGDSHKPIDGLRRGCRIHITRCRRIKTTVNFQHHSAEHEFPPGARLRVVKEWAVHHFKMAPQDAAEHVLQLCGSTERPATDTPLQQLVHGHHCGVCFDLVPEKRVEGCA